MQLLRVGPFGLCIHLGLTPEAPAVCMREPSRAPDYVYLNAKSLFARGDLYSLFA